MTELLGLGLDEALRRLEKQGRDAAVYQTAPLRQRGLVSGILRVVRVDEEAGKIKLWVGDFVPPLEAKG